MNLPWEDIAAHGAIGDGVADDTGAIQAAVNAAGSGGTVFMPQGHFRVTGSITLLHGTRLFGSGAGIRGEATQGSIIDASSVATDVTILAGPGNNARAEFADFGMLGPIGTAPQGHIILQDYGTCAIFPGAFAQYTDIRNVNTFGFTNGLVLFAASYTYATNCDFNNAREHGVAIFSDSHFNAFAKCNFANAGGGLNNHPSNLLLISPGEGQIPRWNSFTACQFDECYDWSFYVKDAQDTTFTDCQFYYANNKNGPRIGSGSVRTRMTNCHIGPFSANVPVQAMLVDAGASDTVLSRVVIDANGGGGLIDDGTNTVGR